MQNPNWLAFGFQHCLKSEHSDFRHSLYYFIMTEALRKGCLLDGVIGDLSSLLFSGEVGLKNGRSFVWNLLSA